MLGRSVVLCVILRWSTINYTHTWLWHTFWTTLPLSGNLHAVLKDIINIFKTNQITHPASQIKFWLSGCKSKNACLNSKQGRPWSDCFFRSSLIWVFAVCLCLFGAQIVFEILEHLLYTLYGYHTHNMGLVMRKHDFVACKQHCRRPACTPVQSGLRLCSSLSGKYINYPHAFLKKRWGYCNRLRPSVCPSVRHAISS